MDIPVEKVQKLKTIRGESGVFWRLRWAAMANRRWAILIEDRWVGSPVDAVIDTNVRDETAGILKTLSPREKVIRLRFGMACEREHTLEEIRQSSTSPGTHPARSKPRRCGSSGRRKGAAFARAFWRLGSAVFCGNGDVEGVSGFASDQPCSSDIKIGNRF